jgi:hypothetical protein
MNFNCSPNKIQGISMRFHMTSIFGVVLLMTLISSADAAAPAMGAATGSPRFTGNFVEGEGDTKTLEAIDAAFESIEPSARMTSLPLLYKRDWNGFVEGPSWPAWWPQNSFGTTYGLLPFLGQEPYASWIRNSQDMWFRLMGDGKRKDFHNIVGPDGCLCDAAGIELNGGSANGFGDFRLAGGGVEQKMDGKIHVAWTAYKQGDSNPKTTDFYIGATEASLVMEANRLLARHDPDQARLAQLKRVAAFLDSRRDPQTNLMKGGHNSNLLAPTFRGVRKADGTYEFGYLTELSVNYVAGLDRLAEVCLLCNQPQDAAGYRAIAREVRQGLPRLMTPDGYFIRSEESDGRHGVFGAATHGYFEAHPNHDAGAFRITDDAANHRIVDFMLHKVKGPQAPGSLIPHGFVLPNYPSYDDHSGEGDMSYGTWTNGGVWPAHEGVMGIACFRAGEFAHPFEAWNAMRPLMEAFRPDAPLANWGTTPWGGQLAKPYCFCYDDWGPVGGILRGLFEYQYAAAGVRLWPHIPPNLNRYAQKVPSYFGQTKIFLAATGSGAVTGALVDGKNATVDADGSIFLPLDGSAKTVTVEFLLGQAKSRGVPSVASTTVIPSISDKDFWIMEPKLPYAPATSPNEWPLRIGASPAGGIYFHGQIKNVRIYREALAEDQVAQRAKGQGNFPELLAQYPLNAAAKDGSFPGAVLAQNAAALSARLDDNKTPKFENGGLDFTDGIALDIPSSAVVDFFENYSMELQIRPSTLNGGRLIDRSTPGTSDGILLDLLANKDAPLLRLITPWGVAQAKVTLRVNEWQHLVATCSKEGLLCLYVDGKKIAETQGKMPVPQPIVIRQPMDFSSAGLFLTAMEKAGLGDSFEAGQARVVVQLIAAYHQRQALAAAGTLRIPDLRHSHQIPPANETKVNQLYRNIARWILGGLQDHLNGMSLQHYPVQPQVLQIAKDTGLIQ